MEHKSFKQREILVISYYLSSTISQDYESDYEQYRLSLLGMNFSLIIILKLFFLLSPNLHKAQIFSTMSILTAQQNFVGKTNAISPSTQMEEPEQ